MVQGKQQQSSSSSHDDWFSTVEQEMEQNRTPIVMDDDTADAIFARSKPTLTSRKPSLSQQQRQQLQKHSEVYKKTQQFLNSKGVGWLMETEDVVKPVPKENLLGGETLSQTDGGEPSILEELDIDLGEIMWRVKQVLVPFKELEQNDQASMRRLLLQDEADFWGPFFIVLAYAMINVAFSRLKLITWVFVIWIVGSWLLWFLTTLIVDHSNQKSTTTTTTTATTQQTADLPPSEQQAESSNQVLTSSNNNNNSATGGGGAGGYLYFSQTIAFVGYGLIPIVLAHALHIVFWFISSKHETFLTVTDFLLGLFTLVWSTFSCSQLMCSTSHLLQEKRKMIWWPVGLLYLYFLAMHRG